MDNLKLKGAIQEKKFSNKNLQKIVSVYQQQQTLTPTEKKQDGYNL